MRKLVIVFFLCSLIVLCALEIIFILDQSLMFYKFSTTNDSNVAFYKNSYRNGIATCFSLIACIVLCIIQAWQFIRHPARQTYEEYKLLQEKLKEQKKHRQAIKKAKQIERLQKKLAEMEKAE